MNHHDFHRLLFFNALLRCCKSYNHILLTFISSSNYRSLFVFPDKSGSGLFELAGIDS